MKKFLFVSCCILSLGAFAQKKPLDHTVYDGWQSVADRAISNDGKYVIYTVNPQEGDGSLYVQSSNGSYKKEIPRGYNAVITDDNRFVICRIKPFFKETRDARIKKRRPDELPKDSLAILDLSKDKLTKVPRVRSYKTPDESNNGWMAYLLDKGLPDLGTRPNAVDSLTRLNTMYSVADSLQHVADSIRNKANDAKARGLAVLQPTRGGGGGGGNAGGGGGFPGGGRGGRGAGAPAAAAAGGDNFEEGTELVLINLNTGETRSYYLVSEYYFSKKGNVLLYETTKKTGDNKVLPAVVKLDVASKQFTTIFQKFNDAKGYTIDEDGKQVAFVAERDSSSNAQQKFYKLYYYKDGTDSATLLASRDTRGLASKWTVAEVGGGGGGARGGGGGGGFGFGGGGGGGLSFSKNGQRLFFGTAPVLPPKDTSLPDFDRVSVDIWHYNDDQVQPAQLRNADAEARRSYLARFDFNTKEVVQLGNTALRTMIQTQEGDGKTFYATTDTGRRIASQWQGFTVSDIYAVNPETGKTELIRKNFKGSAVSPSYTGKYLLFFDEIKQVYNIYNSETKQVYPVAKDIKTALYDEENDVPDDANAYGVVRWMENDKYVLLYDHFDIWQVDPDGKEKSVLLTNGRKDKIQYRYINTDREERFLSFGQKILLRAFDEKDKSTGLSVMEITKDNAANKNVSLLAKEPVTVGAPIKAKDAQVYSYTKESYIKSPDVYVQELNAASARLSYTNLQQQEYNWGTSELFKWKAYTGKETEGVLYKPENFDPKKKYPMIVYFYERNNNTLHNYLAPAPTPSRLNIPFFVSRGYVVFVPDIWYKTGYPGQSAYDYILSGTRAVVKQGYVDSTKIGLQGQSWGGYQIVYLITKTNLYAAAWAGAPVANMTSAYGGIRWGTGILRQFQYEKTQSRIGATLWEKPDLYIKNSALFSLPKVTTPLVIMANDADDAVPWYQGIEMYSGMRRLGKKVWMLTYNGEAHNLVERKNRKDIQIREQQFFDYMLKGDKPAKWISEGVPAVMKGRDLGLGY
jgi:dipeptidyl aminopeptidase/acylaminoacyl peptidase